jgi:hypothetical protein
MGDSETLTEIQHTEVATGRTYEALAEAFEHELGHLDPLTGVRLIEQKASWNEVEREVARMAGPRGLMIIFRADQGKITSLSGREKNVRSTSWAIRSSLIGLSASICAPVSMCRSGCAFMTMEARMARLSPMIGRHPFSPPLVIPS